MLEKRWPLLAILSLLAVLVAMAVSLGDVLAYAGFDLRPKVLGARALLQGLDPYLPDTLAWTAATPPTLTDPEMVFYPGLSRVTYPPSLLLIYLPFAELPYGVQRILWWGLEWLAMLGAVAVLAASIADRPARRAFLVAAALFFCGSWFWRWHVERGQYYVFLVLLVGLDLLALRLAARARRPAWIGLPIGVAVAFRPTLVVLLPLLWLMRERRAALQGAVAAAVLLAASLAFAGPTEWRHYLQNVTAMAEQVAGIGQAFGTRQAEAPAGASFLIEGYDFSHARELPLRSRNLTLCGLTGGPWCLTASKAAALLVPVLAAGLLLCLRAVRAPRELLLLVVMGVPVLLDYTVPMRWSYADVVFLPLLAIVLPAILARPRPLAVGVLAAALLTCLPLIDRPGVSVLRQALFVGTAALAALALFRRSDPHRAGRG